MRHRAPDLLAFSAALLQGAGLPEDRARVVAEVLLEGDLPLTPRGVEEGKRLASGRASGAGSGDRLTRDMERELERMLSSEALRLFARGSGGGWMPRI